MTRPPENPAPHYQGSELPDMDDSGGEDFWHSEQRPPTAWALGIVVVGVIAATVWAFPEAAQTVQNFARFVYENFGAP